MALALPTAATGSETWGSFVQSAPIAGFIFDRPIVNVWNNANCSFSANTPLSLGTGDAVWTEVGTSGCAGFLCNADGDVCVYRWPVPQDIDFSKEINFRVLWSNSQAAATGSCTFVFKYLKAIAGTTAIVLPATAVDTAPADQVDLAADVALWSGWAGITGGTITTMTPGDDTLHIGIDAQVTTISNATQLAVQARYYRKYLA